MDEGDQNKAAGRDRRGMLEEHPFAYQALKDGRVIVSRDGRPVTTLGKSKGEKFLQAAALLDAQGVQQLLARLTGHYKHGNER